MKTENKSVEVRLVEINGKETELTVEIKDETIVSTLKFFIDGKESMTSKISARKRPGGVVRLNVNAFECFQMLEHHSRVHQAIVEDIRLKDELEQALDN